MTGSTAIDIVIGLVFIYLLYSLFVTILQEIIAINFSFRAKILETAIVRMLNDEPREKLWMVSLFQRLGSVFRLFAYRFYDQDTLKGLFYKNPLIKYLAQDSWHSKPSYISSSNFSKVMIDLLRGDEAKPGQDFRALIQKTLDDATLGEIGTIEADKKVSETFQFLRSLWADSQGDIEKFRTSLEKWFDDTMERATGWYKQYTQVILSTVGLIVVIIFNVDTIQIVKKLSSNPTLTALVVQQAGNFVKEHPEFEKELKALKGDSTKLKAHRDSLFSKANRLLNTDIKNISNLLGMGWEKTKDGSSSFFGYKPTGYKGNFWHTLLGWLLSALAISMGAPFWFDLLNKLMKLRGSVATVTGSSSEKEKSAASAKVIIPKG